MKHYMLAGALLSLMCGVHEGHARIGESYEGCERLWGIPVEGETGSASTGRSVFSLGGVLLEICFVDGIAQKVTVDGAVMNDQAEIQKTLTQLGGGEMWHPHIIPGLRVKPPTETVTRRWMRADEAAMAEWAPGGRLTVIGARWHQHLAEPRQKESTKPDLSPTLPLSIPPAKAPVEVKGFWRADSGEHAFVVLQVDADGALSWVRYGGQERNTKEMRWRPGNGKEGTDIWVYEGDVEVVGDPIGKLALKDSGFLAWQITDDSVRAEELDPSLRLMHGMEFKRLTELPTWQPLPPDILPVLGDSRAQALQLLGEPDGRIASGTKEVLLYAWGRVHLMNGRVESVY